VNLQVLREKLEQKGVESFFDFLKPHLEPTIHLQAKYLKEERIPIGASKVGGYPDLPADAFEWPGVYLVGEQSGGDQNTAPTVLPLTFLAQIIGSSLC
jgi:uncharacterized protein YwqG